MALRVAEAAGGEIISADAFQIYRGLGIGTAQPTTAERARAPFHLVGELDPAAPFTVADFQRRAEAAIAEVWSRGRLPILSGGTGLYLRAVLRHFEIPPTDPQAQVEVRARLQQESAAAGLAALYRRLQAVDPLSAARLAPQDERRIIRALEVWELTGRPISEAAGVDRAPRVRYNASTYVLTCPRELLYARIERRGERMLTGGWLEEAQALQETGLPETLPALRALGYGALFRVLRGGLTLPAAAEQISRATRNYAKRQLTWLRREWGFTWMTWSAEAEYDRFARHLTEVAAEASIPSPARRKGRG
jgi:tRNA dimethylallyltransferase